MNSSGRPIWWGRRPSVTPLRGRQFQAAGPAAMSLMTIWGGKNMGHFFFDSMLRVTLFDRLDDLRFLVPARNCNLSIRD